MASFADQVMAFSKKALARKDATIRESIMGLASSLVERSPVGDPALWAHPAPKAYVPGTFKANWQGGDGAINYTTTDETDPTGELSLVNISRALSENVHDAFYITNSLPYAIALENGHSNQAPLGIVSVTVVQWKDIVHAALVKVIGAK